MFSLTFLVNKLAPVYIVGRRRLYGDVGSTLPSHIATDDLKALKLPTKFNFDIFLHIQVSPPGDNGESLQTKEKTAGSNHLLAAVLSESR